MARAAEPSALALAQSSKLFTATVGRQVGNSHSSPSQPLLHSPLFAQGPPHMTALSPVHGIVHLTLTPWLA